jgi:hypothetical protein
MPRTDTQEELLKDLKGVPGLTHFESIDAAKFPQPDPDTLPDPLVVGAPTDTRTPEQKRDARHATKAGGSGYLCVVEGEYTALAPNGGKGKVRKTYRLEFMVPQQTGALQLIVSKLLTPALRKFYPDSTGYRTHAIVSCDPVGDAPPPDSLRYMNRAQLEEFARLHRVPVNLTDYPVVADLRETLIDWKLNPKGFEAREARRQGERAEMAELLRLNPHLNPDAPQPPAAKAPESAPAADPFLE